MKKNKLFFIGLGTAVVVGVGLIFLIKANKNKLAKKQWEDAGSPGTFEDWKKLNDIQKKALALIPQNNTTGVPNLATPGIITGMEVSDSAIKGLNISPIAGTISSLFQKKPQTKKPPVKKPPKKATDSMDTAMR